MLAWTRCTHFMKVAVAIAVAVEEAAAVTEEHQVASREVKTTLETDGLM